jgi:hypothetical protein
MEYPSDLSYNINLYVDVVFAINLWSCPYISLIILCICRPIRTMDKYEE